MLISVLQYVERFNDCPNILKQSVGWRLDHILDAGVSNETRQQWVDEIREIMEEL